MNFLGNTLLIDVSGNCILFKDSLPVSSLPCFLCIAQQKRNALNYLKRNSLNYLFTSKPTLGASQLRIGLPLGSAEGIGLLAPLGPCLNEGVTGIAKFKSIYLQFSL